MATLNKFNVFVEALAEKVHDLGADTLKVALTNTLPVNTQTVFDSVTNHPAPATTNGYTAGGNSLTITSSAQTAGTYKLVLADTTFTSTGTIGPFRYAVLYNSTAGANNLIGWYDYGSSVTLNNTETFTVDFDAVNGVLTLV